jgi:hypothetical protein
MVLWGDDGIISDADRETINVFDESLTGDVEL